MLLKVIFDKTAFVKFMISNNLNKTLMKHIQNNQSSIGKSIPAYGFLKPKVSRLLPIVCDFRKENYTLWYGFKIYR
jgi:hypothetical protein